MSEQIEKLIQSHEELKEALQAQALEFAQLTGELRQRCPNNERRIEQLERNRNSSRRNGWIDPKFWTTAIIALGALATAIAAIVGGR